MAQTISDGSQSTTQTITTADTYILAAGATRTQTAATAIQATVASGATTIDIEGTLTNTASGQRAIRAALANGSILVGANGTIRALDGDAVQTQAFTGANAAVVSTVNLTNLGQIVSATSIGAITTTGATPPGATYALNYNASVGTANAPATDFSSGGVITNGSTSNTAASIRSDSGDAIRLGAHQTLVNYGTISGNGPVNDSSSNNSFNASGNTSVAQRYDISRGVRINAATATNDTIDNYGLIQGAQHGVDVGNTAATNIQVVNRAGATILGHNGSGVGADTTGAAVGTVVVINSGTIRGEYAPTFDRAGYATRDGDGDGVDVDGSATVINNAGGLIAGSGANGVLNGPGAGGFDSNGRANRSEGLSLGGGLVVNNGTISGADTAIVVNNDSNATGSRSGVAATSITNGATGSIIGQNGYAIRFENKTGAAAIDDDTIVNAGTITGNGNIPAGTVLRQDGNPDPGTVGTLNGTTYTSTDAGSARFIAGDGAAIQTGEGGDTLTNYGTIAGNTGRAISLEGGNDTLNLYTGSMIIGRIDGGAGTDTLNLRLDDRSGSVANLGGNSGATASTLRNVINFENLAVQSGSWTIADAQSYATGTIIASGAGLLVDGAVTSPVTVASGGLLGGAGTVTGNVIVDGTISGSATASGVISSIGTLSTGALTLDATAILREDITGAAADLLRASGAVTLNTGVTLDLEATSSFTSAAGQSITLLDNTSASATTGRFASLILNGAASATIAIDDTFQAYGRSYQISYTGTATGSTAGNDVTITDVTAAPGGSDNSTPPGPTTGDDNLTGTAAADTVALGFGNDSFTGGTGADLVYGNQGNDLIYGNQDADVIYGGQGDDRAYGGMGDDRLYGNLGNDVLYGNMGNDIVYGNQGADIVYGNQGNDSLYGGMGDDVLYGGMGDDILVGGLGNNILVGGVGADRYVFGANPGARDLVLGFNQGEGDRLSLGGQTYTTGTAQNGDALLTLSGGGTIDLAGIKADQVNASFFAA